MLKLVVLLSVAALAAAKPSVVAVAPLAYSAGVVAPGVTSVSQYGSSVVHGYGGGVVAAPAPLAYGAVSLAPQTPAVVLGPHGVPLDTPEVVAARAQHYTAKALAGSGVHYLRKRSLVAAPAVSYAAASPVVSAYSAYSASPVVSAYSTYSASPVVSAYSAYPAPVLSYSAAAPLAYSSHVYAPRAYGVHSW